MLAAMTEQNQRSGPAGQEESDRDSPRAVPERLLEVASRLFAARGFDGASVQDIVGAAGLTKGAMYHYFDSKDDLLHEIYARIIRPQRARLETIAGAPDAAVGRLRTAAEDFVVTTVQNLDEVRVFLTAVHRLRSDQRRGVEAERRRFHDTFTALIDEGQNKGAFRDDIPADLVVHNFVGSVHHLGTWYDPTGPLAPPTLAVQYSELLVTSLEPRRP